MMRHAPAGRVAPLFRGLGQDRRDIAAAVQHPDDADRAGEVIVDNQVGEHLPEFHWLAGEVLTQMSETRHGGEQAERSADGTHHIPGNGQAGFSNQIFTDFAKVLLGFRR